MLTVLKESWALLLGLLMLMLGNGLQGSLLGVRGALEGYDPGVMSYVMSAYFLGFLGGSRLTPLLIRRVGHVRVFAALASLISAAFILYAAIPHPVAWALLRLLVGVCFAGVYVVAESWLNDRATNETRGQALSAYVIVQMVGLIVAQTFLNLADPGGFMLFVLISVLVSVSFAPILLTVSPAPVFQVTRALTLRQLFRASPLGFVATILLGGVFSAMFGMAAVFGSEAGLSVAQISIFVAAIYTGGLVAQYPIGWLSDRMDRRRLIMIVTAVGAAAGAVALVAPAGWMLIVVAAIIGGAANPLYSLLIAHTNDFLQPDEMPAASGGLIFLNGLGAVGGPLVVGWLMQTFAPKAYFAFMAVLFAVISLYALYRTTRRPTVVETGTYVAVSYAATPVGLEVAQSYAVEQQEQAAGEADADLGRKDHDSGVNAETAAQ